MSRTRPARAIRARRALALVPGLAVWAACAATPVEVRLDPESERTLAGAAIEAVATERIDAGPGHRDGVWHPGYFDQLLPADALVVKGLRERHVREGVGLRLVGLRRPSGEAEADYPPEGITRAVTAVVAEDAAGAPAVRLLDPTRHGRVETAKGLQPLAADFTAPYALLLSRTRLERSKLLGAFRPAAPEARSGIFLLEPYDPNRIPLLMVHGLLASPLTWRELTNAVFGAADVRSRYQVWHALYPTGLPFLHAAADLRARLGALRRRLDPEGDDFATGHLVVVAHSKGGLLAKTLVSDSGDRLWRAAFAVPPAELVASPADRAEMERFLFFEREPAVRRVIFIATPHRGSRLAENPLARLLSAWVSLPFHEADAFERVLTANAEHLTPGFRTRLESGLPAGSRALSHRDPLIGPLAEIPIPAEVPFHSIVGEARPGLFSDGVVDHASSHQPGAASELVVADGHGVHRSEEAIAEVLRILRQHGAPTAPTRR